MPSVLLAVSCRLAFPTTPFDSCANDPVKLSDATWLANNSATPAAIPISANPSPTIRVRRRTR